MKEPFRWNPFADQPHNVAPKSERFRHHLKYWNSYFPLLGSILTKAGPGLKLYHRYRKTLYERRVDIHDPFALCFSPDLSRNAEILKCFKDLNITQGLLRIPSWELNRLSFYQEALDFFLRNGMDLTIALLQQRSDVLKPAKWRHFLEAVFSRFSQKCRRFEIGHAWNRTKWGLWNYREYVTLAEAAMGLAQKYKIQLIGPAVIDFEFHLYPAVLKAIPFDIISSLLYVDRVGAPENKQFGWDLSKKTALLRAAVDVCSSKKKELWVTEFNWPLKGTGKYSPASGKPNVTEKEQADYLSRYYILTAAGGLIQRAYWWQLAAPGYGLIDNRKKTWRKRPAYYALKTLISHLKNSTFVRREKSPSVNVFFFKKDKQSLAVCWTNGPPVQWTPSSSIKKVVRQDGTEVPPRNNRTEISHAPKYVYLDSLPPG